MEVEIGSRLLVAFVVLAVAGLVERWWSYAGSRRR